MKKEQTIRQALRSRFGRTKPSSVLDVAKRLKWLLSNPNRWAKGSYGTHKDSTSCCIVGAISQIGGRFQTRASNKIYRMVPIRFTGAIGFNDSRTTTHETIKKFLSHVVKHINEPNPPRFKPEAKGK